MIYIIILLIGILFARSAVIKYSHYRNKLANTYSLIELQEIKTQIKHTFFLLGKKNLLKWAEYWHKEIVNTSLFNSNINLKKIIESGKNLAGDTTSEDEIKF